MRRLLSLAVLLAFGLIPAPAEAGVRPSAEPAPSRATTVAGKGRVFLSIEEALALAFRGCEVHERTAYLKKDERERAAKLAHTDVPQSVVRYYVAEREGKLVGTAYVEAHKVRTLKETVMVVVGPTGRLQRFELLSFGEPVEYIPRGSWYAQLTGRCLDDELDLDRGIRGVTGATLTAKATIRSARRLLALHAVLADRSGSSPTR